MRGIDIAINLLDKSIQRGKEDERYYMDFVKLHKLIFLGQCYHRYVWDIDLVDNNIVMREDGPYINGLNSVVAYCGFDEIKNIDELKREIGFYFPVTPLRNETCDFILDNFGRLSTMDLVKLTKQTDIFKKMIGCNNSVVNNDSIYNTGATLFEKDKVKVKNI